MAIPLIATPAPKPDYEDLIDGDSRMFTSSLGGWINSGGTLSRQTADGWVNNPNRLQLVTTATGQYARLPLNGVFKAGERYDFAIVGRLAEAPAQVSWRVRFGLDGTDHVNFEATQVGSSAPGNNEWRLWCGTWIPSADRTGVTLTLYRVGVEVGTQTWSIGYARAARIPAGGSGLTAFRYEHDNTASGRLRGLLNVQSPQGAGIDVSTKVAQINAGSSAYLYISPGYVDLFSEHTPGERPYTGVNVSAGADWVGVHISEKDADTAQLYPLGDQDVEIIDGDDAAASRHWHAVTADGVRSRLGGWFEQVLRVPGGLSAATDVADYLQAPHPLRIDEVFIHAGTAPTGSALIVDVNDDGTTVFTTQGNRPTIADGSNDATSGAADGGTAIAKGSVITVDVDQVGSSTPGSDLFVSIRGRYIW